MKRKRERLFKNKIHIPVNKTQKRATLSGVPSYSVVFLIILQIRLKIRNDMETTWLKALYEGDEKAFEKIYLAYYKRTLYFLAGLVKSEEDAKELTQEVFIKLWTNRETLDIAKSAHNYMYTLARNAAFNFLKHKLVEINYVNEYVAETENNTSEEILFAKEITLLVEMTVNRMPLQRQRIYKMSRNEGMSNEEIASRLHISKKTVENQLSLALGELKKVIVGMILFFF